MPQYDDSETGSHITKMSTCIDVGRIEVDEEWDIRVDYDIIAHAPMLDRSVKPKYARGLAIMYIVES